jgi:amino acid transporter
MLEASSNHAPSNHAPSNHAPSNHAPSNHAPSNHGLKRELGLRDLVPMQILLVVGLTWAGTAAHLGQTHVVFWIGAVLLLFVPLASVVGWCAKIWPTEGGIYQWTKAAWGPLVGFMTAWNFGMWALMAVAAIGVQVAAAISYAIGPRAAWMQENHWLLAGLTTVIFLLILLVNVFGLGVGRWVAHFGTSVTVLITLLLLTLLFWHPHTSAAHPHVNPQKPFGLELPIVTLLSINLFSKVAFNALSGLEQVAVFAGETRDPGKAILRSAWIAAPIIVLIYVLMTGSMLTYTPADKINLASPIPQVLAAAFGGGSTQGIDWGLMLGRVAILVLAIALIGQYSVIIAETSRMPLVAGWDGLLPAWFTKLDPRWKTPTRSLLVIVLACIAVGLLASVGTGAQEAFQLLTDSGNICYGLTYLMLFAIPLFVGSRFGTKPGSWLKLAALSGLGMTLLAIGFQLLPITDVSNVWAFAAKVSGTALLLNSVGLGIYLRGTRRMRLTAA